MSRTQLPLDFSSTEPDIRYPPPLSELMDQWVAAGWMRRVDRAVGRWLLRQVPAADPRVILAAVLASHQAGHGHVCLDLTACLDDPDTVLQMPPQAGRVDRDAPMPQRPSQWLQGWSLAAWMTALTAAPRLIDGVDGSGRPSSDAGGAADFPEDVPPFVLDGHRLYLRRYWQQEQAIADQILRRVDAVRVPPDAFAVRVVRETLDRLFDTPSTTAPAYPDWQKIACAVSMRRGFSLITGGPGTGKTTTVVKFLLLSLILAIRTEQPLPRIRLCAPTGKAAARLKQSIQGQIAALLSRFGAAYPALTEALPQTVETLHRLIGVRPNQPRPRHHAANRVPADIVVIDEASMIGQELMARTLAALAPETQLVLLGDRDQLASVEPGSVLGALCTSAGGAPSYDADTRDWIEQATGCSLEPGEEPGSRLSQTMVTLRHSHRFGPDSPIGVLARAVNAGDADASCRLLRSATPGTALRLLQDDRRFSRLTRVLIEAFTPWLSRIHDASGLAGSAQDDWARTIFDLHRQVQVLCALRRGPQGVAGLNDLIEQALHRAGLLPGFDTRAGPWYAGRPVLVTRNDAALRLANGDIGLTLPYRRDAADAPMLRVAFPGDEPGAPIRWLNPHRLPPCDTAFALTVHKAQGSEFGHTLFVLPVTPNPILSRELIYTALTRARDHFTLIGTEDDPALAVFAEGVRRQVRRVGQLDRLCRVV